MAAVTELRPAMWARLSYLDQRLKWLGQANRRDLIEAFGVSNAQAAIDFRVYLDKVREPIPAYDPVRKTYVAARGHRGLSGVAELDSLEGLFAQACGAGYSRLPGPSRQCSPAVTRELCQAMAQKLFIEIDYVSMSSGRRDRRWIAPAHFASDGERLHVRAWSCEHEDWRDYLPVRVSVDSSFATRPIESPLPRDEDWETMVQIRLRPRSDLTIDQKRAVQLEYGFEGDALVFEVRRALEFYVERRWGLDQLGARLERFS